jgi:flagellar hook assembly protein FlgD
MVRELLLPSTSAGEHTATWDGRDGAGRSLPAGVYHFRLVTGDQIQTSRVVRVH